MATYYVNNTLHAADAATGTATGGGNDYILLEDKGILDDDTFNNYGIQITGGTGQGQNRRIIDYDDSGNGNGECYAQVNSAWTTNPDATSTYRITVGCDENNGAIEGVYDSSDGSFANLSASADVAGIDDKVWVKAGADYDQEDGGPGGNDCIMEFDSAVIFWADAPIWEGYKSSTGDGGIVTVDAATDSCAYCILCTADIAIFKNFQFEGASDDGFECGSNDAFCFKNCRFTNNSNNGINGIGNDKIAFENCSFDNNGGDTGDIAANLNDDITFIACLFYANAGEALHFDSGTVYACLSYNNGNTTQFRMAGAFHVHVINCTLDGEGGNATIGVSIDATANAAYIINSIIHDCQTGISTSEDMDEMCIARNNLYNSNVADVSNFMAVSTGDGVGDRGDVADTPDFTDEANDDYTIAAAGNPLAAGLDAKFTDDFWDSFIAANNPPTP